MNFLFLFQSECSPHGTKGESASASHGILAGARAERAVLVHGLQPGRTYPVVVEARGHSRALVEAASKSEVRLRIENQFSIVPEPALSLVVGLSRPQTVKKVLELAATVGVRSIDFVASESGEKSYQNATVLSGPDLQEHLIRGVEQGGGSRLPEVAVHSHVKKMLAKVAPQAPESNSEQGMPGSLKVLADTAAPASATLRGVLAEGELAQCVRVFLAVGPEAGWSSEERRQFLERGFRPISLGPRILRVEQALAFLLGQVQLLSTRDPL